MAAVTSCYRRVTAAALTLHHHQPAFLAVRLRLRLPRRPIPTNRAMSSSSAASVASPHQAGAWYVVPDLSLRDHRFAVPLDHSSSGSPSITVFAREVVAAGKEEAALPYLMYLQGGPGFESPRPTEASGWVKKACEEYRVVLLDQRGTGLSTPLTTSSLSQITPAAEQVEYLKHFRADNIVKDAEFIRLHLVPDAKPWTILGQSYGGFCAVTYLSFAPEGLKSVLLTGGLPPLGKPCTADDVYRACFKQVQLQNEKYYKRYPQDIQVIHEVVRYLSESEGGGVLLPSGGRLTPKMLQCLGLSGLGSGGGFERLHYLLERVWDPILVPGAKTNISYYFLKEFEMWLGFDQNPLYALLHESIYCEVTYEICSIVLTGTVTLFCCSCLILCVMQGSSSKWSADKIFSEYGNLFDPVKATEEGRAVYLTGEMVFPCFFDEIHALRPLKEAAHLLAEKEDWPPLYDISVLNNNKVPVAAAVYYEDMYVNFNIAKETASQIAGIRLWVTNEYMHSGLRDGGSHVFEHLMGLLKGKKPLF
ncbi:proline iminopeptidase isoform X1 [Lolium rigidum]|uniref:proline iminopeptidase isoform X1 n=1 Tax=Lolium rigidum TaxID=89674 RepID=UPI001F5E3447|nr:proline iminopeptidase isoform X1 [Lolium rigidum]